MVEVFVYKIKRDDIIEKNKYLPYLTFTEKKEINRFYDVNIKNLAYLYKYLTKKSISEYLNININDVVLERDKYNRPYLKDNNKYFLDFNISHSGDRFIIALSKGGRVGIDVEKYKNIDFMNISNNFFHKKEFLYISNNYNEINKNFYKIWTLKESYLKALGLGLSGLSKNFYFKIKNDNIELVKSKRDKYKFRFIDIGVHYQAAVCFIARSDINVNYLELN